MKKMGITAGLIGALTMPVAPLPVGSNPFRKKPAVEAPRHPTKAGPGRGGNRGRSRHTKLHTGTIHRGSGQRNLKKLLGTRP